MSYSKHHVENLCADQCPEGRAQAIALVNAIEGYFFIAVDCFRATVASGNVVASSLGCEENDSSNQKGKAEASEGEDGNAMGNLIVATFGVIHSKGKGTALL